MDKEPILNFFHIFPSPDTLCMVINYRFDHGVKSCTVLKGKNMEERGRGRLA